MKKIEWDDIAKLCIVEYCEAYLEFKIYDITGHKSDEKGNFVVPIYEKKGAISSEDETGDFNEAKIYISGSIKWDACSHITFCEEDNGYIHICGGYDWKQFIILMERIFNLGREYFISDHQKEEFDNFEKLQDTEAENV